MSFTGAVVQEYVAAMKHIPLFVVVGVFLSSCEKQDVVAEPVPETLVSDYEEDEMDQAISKARATTDEFLEVHAEGDADSFSVKAPITDENGTEHFWLTDVTLKAENERCCRFGCWRESPW